MFDWLRMKCTYNRWDLERLQSCMDHCKVSHPDDFFEFDNAQSFDGCLTVIDSDMSAFDSFQNPWYSTFIFSVKVDPPPLFHRERDLKKIWKRLTGSYILDIAFLLHHLLTLHKNRYNIIEKSQESHSRKVDDFINSRYIVLF